MLLQKPQTQPFDPNQKNHRLAVHAFMKRNAWSDSAIRFSYDPAYSSVADQVQTKLLKWYMSQEAN